MMLNHIEPTLSLIAQPTPELLERVDEYEQEWEEGFLPVKK